MAGWGNGFVGAPQRLSMPRRCAMAGHHEQSCHSTASVHFQQSGWLAGPAFMVQGSGLLMVTWRLQLQIRLVLPLILS